VVSVANLAAAPELSDRYTPHWALFCCGPALTGLAPQVHPRLLGLEHDDDRAAVLVDGVLCARDHFNDPAARACRQCGVGLDQPPRAFQRRRTMRTAAVTAIAYIRP